MSERSAQGVRVEHVRALRVGHGGNCSSVGSVVDTLFLGAAAGGAVLAAVLAAMGDERVRVVGRGANADADANADGHADADADAGHHGAGRTDGAGAP
ncbi:MAG: hypothetical protein JWP97_1775 [Labilithrix sp.]|nr:hypothetical protein [Labilithrix sp.]